ncbi:hypothetical protein F0P96_18085 [Hymenobacter busanensis]|uniref:Uncharacterized protein n=1 Tax=Hymenobacter busanensis TaxID=2607656 RepID=A0A7L4ZS23_9BACT|nr:hypothetical protein [Hymenobacter busanensis]KAA9327146.1 hypothetical protein F0P96_18085 [Hymenobacter busanensis]QHJ05811.1 hypothetical protein GUY19_00280 [Hymenobacter busanensis]
MNYPVELLTTRAECNGVKADTQADIDRTQFRITAALRSATLQTNEATEDSAKIGSLTDQITPLEARIATMPAGDARTREEIRLRGLKRDREALEDEQLGGQGGRGAFRRQRELDAAQRQLAGYQDCLAQVQARHDALPA